MTDGPPPSRTSLKTWLGILALLLLTGAVGALIKLTEPEPEREAAVKRTAMLVEVLEVEVGDYTPQIPAVGVVLAAEDVTLQPRVSGQITALGREFVPGSVVEAGEVLLELERVDAANAVALAESALALAQADLELEQGRQAVARIERDHIGAEISAEQERLVLREPQLQAAQATVDAARANLKQAELELSRTRVRAPSRSLVLERSVGVGSLVTPSSTLGRLVAVERFWVELTLPTRLLQHLPEQTTVRLRDDNAWPAGATRQGTLSGVVRALDQQTRLARLLVTVEDPLALEHPGPPLSVGAFLQAELQANTLSEVIRLPRGALRREDIVWTMEEGLLRLRTVEVLVQDADYAYIRGLEAGAQVVLTDLASVSDGAPLRTEAQLQGAAE